ncbi:Phospho-2-dehydro-3-deoxyheptonate aldolase, phenylalanine-inhibited [Venturia inaequalis]|nr:Phospho-2-dehydro-3-deoxyheptonate aldolase, phenylalanine-inhibited [Venturia inaequalis]
MSHVNLTPVTNNNRSRGPSAADEFAHMFSVGGIAMPFETCGPKDSVFAENNNRKMDFDVRQFPRHVRHKRVCLLSTQNAMIITRQSITLPLHILV